MKEAPDDGMQAIVLPKPYHVSDATLVDTEGHASSLKSVSTKPLTLVYFGYTNCKDVCPTTLGNIAAALARISDTERHEVGLVFVTSDPARDDEKTMRKYLDRFDPSFVGLTGDIAQIIDAGNSVGVYVEEGTKLASGGYDVTHGDTLTGVLPDGSAPLVWDNGFSSKQLSADLDQVLTDGVPPVTG